MRAVYIMLLFVTVSSQRSFGADRDGVTVSPPSTTEDEIAVILRKLQINAPYIHRNDKVAIELYYQADTGFTGSLFLACYILEEKDSSLVYKARNASEVFKHGVGTIKLELSGTDSAWIDPDLAAILRTTDAMPAGEYHTLLTIIKGGDTSTHSFLVFADSSLAVQSKAREALQDVYAPEKKISVLGVNLGGGMQGAPVRNAKNIVNRSTKKLNRMFKAKGLTTVQRGEYIDIYYKDWFVGYYQLDLDGSVVGTINRERQQLSSNAAGLARNELTNIRSIFTQAKELNKKNKEQREVSGEIRLTGNMSNGQEENSANENNYYEINGMVEVPVMGIPVSLEGYYTSQDRNRQAKAGYFRIHYDTEKAKEELLKLVNGYKSSYENTVAKGKGLEGVYQSYLSRLSAEKGKLLTELKKETGISNAGYNLDTAALRTQLTDSLNRKLNDSSNTAASSLNKTADNAKKVADSVNAVYEQAMSKYEKIERLQQDINKYQKLLHQYKTTTFFDSSLSYDNIKDLDDVEDLSYKELARKAETLLPEGKVKSFITGLTHFDAGIFNKEVSSYTLSGQTIKGLDAGYDLGFCQTSFTVGRIEYAGRDGSLDRYTGYSGRVSFKPGKKQKASIVYYGYTPSKKMLHEDTFFDDVDVSMPSFQSPVHIVSVSMAGSVKNNINYESEMATSFRGAGDRVNSGNSITDRMAYHVKVDGDIPNTSIMVDVGYEHVGKDFENNSAPVNLSGIDRYHIGGKGLFFKNFLTLGVEYNYLEQQSFSGKGGNTKWGFEIRTHSKRYPSVSLSYKPFSTFRSYADTLDIPQRPLIGEVWTGKASYQVKKKDYSIRFMAVYNKNASTMDTMNMSANMAQFNCIYLKGKLMGAITLGNTTTGSNSADGLHRDVNFAALNAGYSLNTQWTVSGGVDGGLADFGLTKYGGNAGAGYTFKKVPLAIRGNIRYSTYRLQEDQEWKQLTGGTIDLSWRFRFKMSEK